MEVLQFFLAPSNLLSSPQSDLLKLWLKKNAQLVAMITLPENLFSQGSNSKAIFVLQKKGSKAVEPFVYPLNNLRDSQELADFKEKFQIWSQYS